MSESATTLASFNVDKEAWEQFKSLAKDNGLSASYGLNELIKQALQRGSISPIEGDPQSIADIDLSGYIEKSEFEAVIANLTGQLSEVMGEIDDLKKPELVA